MPRYFSSMKKTSARSKVTAPAQGKSPQQALVAIVDDDESVRDAVGSLFRSMGFRTELFGSGKEFLGAPNLRDFSCLVLDVQMPGMDGLELQRTLALASADRDIDPRRQRPAGAHARDGRGRDHSPRDPGQASGGT